MKKIILTFFLSLIIPAFLWSEPTTVSGTVTNGNGYTIRLMTYSDQVTYLRKTLAGMTMGADGKFSFTVDINETIYCWLDIEFQQAEIFLQPGQDYVVELELQESPLLTSYYNRTGIPVKIIKDDSSHLNVSIRDFNELYNDFLLNYSDNIRQHGSKTAYEIFIKAIDLRFQNETNPYFRNYIRYKTASMQLFMRLKSRDHIGLEFITGQSVLYNQLEYMDFFHLYFEKYFVTGGKNFGYDKTYDLINEGQPLGAILDSLESDTVLQDLEVRELLLLDGLKDLYNSAGFDGHHILALITELSEKGSSPEIKYIASNVLTRLKRLQPGTEAPGFNLPGVTEKGNFNLSDFKGKLVYLAFFESQNPASQSELGMIRDIYDDEKTKVDFVAISVDKDISKLEDYLARADLPWLVLSYNGDLDLLENYDAIAFPYFVLIDREGRILLCPAPSPSEDIRKVFDSKWP